MDAQTCAKEVFLGAKRRISESPSNKESWPINSTSAITSHCCTQPSFTTLLNPQVPTETFSSLLSSLPVYFSCLPRSSATSTQGRGDCLLSYPPQQVVRKSFLTHLPGWEPHPLLRESAQAVGEQHIVRKFLEPPTGPVILLYEA